MNRYLATGILLFAGFLGASTLGTAPTTAQPAGGKVKWEYKVLTPSQIEVLVEKANLTAGLNKLGEDGWALVAIEPGHVPPPVRLPRYVFKRAL